jgi:phenylpyruvate tautomerase PptA (4-oxalocrotonate tautomerase family)
MPHLQFEINRNITDAAKVAFAEEVRQLFSKVMDSGTDHVSISIRECGTYDLSIGRVKEPEKGIAIVGADLRKGRTLEQRRALVLGFIDLLEKVLNIPPEHIYITLTEHKGEDFQMFERYLPDWQEGEAPK